MSSIKVLVAGMDNAQNQLMRAVSRYPDCEAIFTDKNSVNFSSQADLVVMCRSCLSNNKFRAIRAAYNGKPVLVAERGFSEIKEVFENTVFKMRACVKPAQEILRVPAAWREKSDVKRNIENLRIVNRVIESAKVTPKPVHDKDRAAQIIKESHAAGLSAKDTLELLAADNLVDHNGQPYSESYVYATRSYLKQKEQKAEQQTAAIVQGESMTAELKMNLINQVIEAPKLDPAQRLDVIRRINSGEIKSLRNVRRDTVSVAGVEQMIITVEDVTVPSNEHVSLTLTKDAAMLIMAEMENIKQFAVGGK